MNFFVRLPNALVILVDKYDQLPREYYVYTIIALMLNSSMNPIFYALTNPKFQKGYLNILDIIMCRKT